VLPPADAGDDKRGEALVYIDNLTAREPDAMKTREARYHFQMTLSLRSRPLGRWNKLEFVRYAVSTTHTLSMGDVLLMVQQSVALETGETEPLPLKHERFFRSPFTHVRDSDTLAGPSGSAKYAAMAAARIWRRSCKRKLKPHGIADHTRTHRLRCLPMIISTRNLSARHLAGRRFNFCALIVIDTMNTALYMDYISDL
jgi:hypothetical protein